MKMLQIICNLRASRREYDALADAITRAQGQRENRVFVEDWREARRRGDNVPEDGLLPPRPKAPPAPPRPQK